MVLSVLNERIFFPALRRYYCPSFPLPACSAGAFLVTEFYLVLKGSTWITSGQSHAQSRWQVIQRKPKMQKHLLKLWIQALPCSQSIPAIFRTLYLSVNVNCQTRKQRTEDETSFLSFTFLRSERLCMRIHTCVAGEGGVKELWTSLCAYTCMCGRGRGSQRVPLPFFLLR